jgi:hypothetical protein
VIVLEYELLSFIPRSTLLTEEGKMKGSTVATRLIVPIVLAASVASTAVGGVTIELLNPPPCGLLELGVDESYTFDIQITSDDDFVLAMATIDAYYPGRGVRRSANDTAHRTTSAVLHITLTGKGSTAGLPAVYDWPEPGMSWQEGTAPVSIVAGVRYQGGVVISERFSFAVAVP